MFALMFGMGLTLSVGDFRRIARAPLATFLGTLLQLVGMPIVGLALARIFDLPPLLAAGLVLMAACPGGMFSNLYVYFARANGALSVTLTATATMATLFTLPLWVQLSLSGSEGPAGEIIIPIGATALQLAGLTVLPVIIGMSVRSRWPGALRFEKWFSRIGAVVIVVIMVYDGAQQPELPLAEFQQVLAPTLLFAVAALVLGLVVPLVFGLATRDAVTIGVELVVKNLLLGVVLAREALTFEALIPILAFSFFQTPIGVMLLVGWRLLARSGLVAGPEPPAAETPP